MRVDADVYDGPPILECHLLRYERSAAYVGRVRLYICVSALTSHVFIVVEVTDFTTQQQHFAIRTMLCLDTIYCHI